MLVVEMKQLTGFAVELSRKPKLSVQNNPDPQIFIVLCFDGSSYRAVTGGLRQGLCSARPGTLCEAGFRLAVTRKRDDLPVHLTPTGYYRHVGQ